MKGVVVEYATVDKAELNNRRPAKKLKSQNMSLLDGLLDWRAVKKGGRF